MALRALHTATTGMRAQQLSIDVISNNLANVTTTGFKRQRVDFQDLLYQEVRRAGTTLNQSQSNQRPTSIQVGVGVKDVATRRDFSQGALENTGLQLDLAIEGPGFFRIKVLDNQAPEGFAFSRDGSFTVDKDGNIVTSQGYFLDPQLTVPENTIAINVSIDGQVEAVLQDQAQAQQIGQIQLSTFRNPEGLGAIGDNLFVQTDASGTEQQLNPGAQGAGILRQGFLESSNVNVVQELVDLIEAQRAYEVNANSIETADEMLRTANSLRR
ncbi:MAG: flagellar basal-body rod protein FlgG [Planctomycetes bacterium]|nr:flagellar basal-body rod protein FlgG [Planctomycetota bacterium]